MPSYITRFYELDPANPPASGTSIDYSVLTITDQNNDDEFDANSADRLDGVDIVQSYGNDVITVNVNGVDVTYVGTTFYLSDGRRFFTSEDGQPLKPATYVGTDTAVDTQSPLLVSQLGPACFVAGSMIETPNGARPIENLRKGDLVSTHGEGAKSIVWVGGSSWPADGEHAPIRFDVGEYGCSRPLLVSPDHRVLLEGWRAELLFGEAEVLVAAKFLVDGQGIRRCPRKTVRYYHILLREHALLVSQGVISESFFPASTHVGPERELQTAIAETLADVPGSVLPVRRALLGYEARALSC